MDGWLPLQSKSIIVQSIEVFYEPIIEHLDISFMI